jgi:biotin-(acetyl-CoA carboxylase) ligase
MAIAPPLDLPPPFRLVTLREVGDAMTHATDIASEAGAGTLVYVGRFDLVEFSVVLEPDEPLRTARRVLYAGVNALVNALASHAPPEKPITLDWPDAIRVDGGLVGGVRLEWPEAADEDQPPPWIVFGAMIRTVAMGEEEPGLQPLATALEDEGFYDAGSGWLVESFTRHLMSEIDAWNEYGFGEVAKNYLPHLALSPPSPVSGGGVLCEIDENGDLLEKRVDGAGIMRRSLVSALSRASWLDPETRAPRK